jgi:hypothetical protein
LLLLSEDGSSVWEWEVYDDWHRMSKRTWDIGVEEVIKREINQAIALAMGGQCRKHMSDGFIGGLGLKPLVEPVVTRWYIGTVHQIYLVLICLIIKVT